MVGPQIALKITNKNKTIILIAFFYNYDPISVE